MSYSLELFVPVASWEEAERLAAATDDPQLMPLRPGRRRRWFRDLPPSAVGGDDGDVLDDNADWSEEAFTLSRRREEVAQTILLLGRIAEPGWTLRSAWLGDDLEHEVELTAAELAELTRRSALLRSTLYRVVAGRAG